MARLFLVRATGNLCYLIIPHTMAEALHQSVVLMIAFFSCTIICVNVYTVLLLLCKQHHHNKCKSTAVLNITVHCIVQDNFGSKVYFIKK